MGLVSISDVLNHTHKSHCCDHMRYLYCYIKSLVCWKILIVFWVTAFLMQHLAFDRLSHYYSYYVFQILLHKYWHFKTHFQFEFLLSMIKWKKYLCFTDFQRFEEFDLNGGIMWKSGATAYLLNMRSFYFFQY